jgi:diguanylate cyclase (GGDEF)-like protein/PAS domain S-box-containing protein
MSHTDTLPELLPEPRPQLAAAVSGTVTAAELFRQKAFFEQLFQHAPFGIAILDNADRVLDANRHWLELFGYALDEVRGRLLNDCILPEHLRDEASELSRRVLEREDVSLETVRRRKDGSTVEVAALGTPIHIANDQVGVYAIYSDISARKRAEQLLQEQKEIAQVTLHSIGDAVVRTDAQGRVEYLNPVAERMTGWPDAEARGQPLTTVFRIVNEKSLEGMPNPVELCLAQDAVIGLANHTLLLARDGAEYAIEDCAAPIRGIDGRILGVVMVFRDVSERRRTADEMAWQASHDALTQLFNRHEFEKRLTLLLNDRRDGGRHHALVYLDLDQFKVVNDTCGHSAGDELLRQLTRVMVEGVCDTDTLARLGGDEFGLLLIDCPFERAQVIASALVERIRAFRFVWHGRTFNIGASAGVVALTHGDQNLAAVLAAADSACYAAKERGGNRVRAWHPDDLDLLRRRDEMDWVSRITQALEEDRFVLHHQNIVALARRDAGPRRSEILLRMVDEQGGLIAPLAFIPAAERYGLMPAIDRWVIDKVFATLNTELRAGRAASNDVYAINVSGATLSQDDLVGFVRECFVRHGIPPSCICFEITETAAIRNLEAARAFTAELRALGCAIALDDFGSGLSSFAYLRNLQVDYIKIDGAFVKNLATDAVDHAMVESINRVGKIMGLRTVAEYCEDADTRRKLHAMGVDFIQGFGEHHPEPWPGA